MPTNSEIQQMIDGDLKRLAMFTKAMIEIMPDTTFKIEDDSVIFDVTNDTIKAFDIMKLAEAFTLAYILTAENSNILLTIY